MIVGVVSDTRMLGPFNNPNVDETGFYVPYYASVFGPAAALGATRPDLLSLVLRDSLRLTALSFAFATSRGLTTLLYNVPTLDLLIYAAALAMTLACGAAPLVPARSAARANPLPALRSE